MRKLVWITMLVTAAWCAWWITASIGMRASIAAWLETRTAEGWQAETSGITGGGFPGTLRAGLTDLTLADPQAGIAIETAALDISARAWWPGDVSVMLDDGPILLASPLGRSTLTMDGSVMSLNLHPGTALELEALGWTAGAWNLANASGTVVQAQDLTLTITQTQGATYELLAQASGFAPGDAIRKQLRMANTIPPTFDSLQLKATVTFDTEWDSSALDKRRPQPRNISLHLAEARWGDLKLNFAADLVVDVNGTPEGTLAIQAQNWRAMLDLAEAAGKLSRARRQQSEGILQALAQASGNPKTLDVTLSLGDGAIKLGFIPLLPSPRLLLR